MTKKIRLYTVVQSGVLEVTKPSNDQKTGREGITQQPNLPMPVCQHIQFTPI